METAVPDNKRRSALGKGIESLLGPRPAPPAVVAAAVEEQGGKPLEIPLDKIDRNPHQTRTAFDEAKLAELAASVRATGVIQPIVVRTLPEGRFQLIMGERRWRASKIAEKTTIPAIVVQVSDAQAMEMTIVENLQRADLNPMEQARAFDRLSKDFQMTQEQMAVRTGKDRASIGNFLRLLRLPRSVQQSLEAGELSFGHARALLALESQERMQTAAEYILEQSMSVRQAEMLVQSMLNPEQPGLTREEKAAVRLVTMDPNVREAQEVLQRRLGLRVRIEDRKGKGKVIIEYSGVDDFDAILSALGDG
jgi:ParB family chromosome partitioning protein